MMAMLLFLCIVLSQLVSLSLSGQTQIFCPNSICMIIDKRVCCGRDANGPKTAPTSIVVITGMYVDEPGLGSAVFEAGFPKDNFQDQQTAPTCYQIFRWPKDALILTFTEDFALAWPNNGQLIPQTFVRSFWWFGVHTEDYNGTNCPRFPNINKDDVDGNPYYDPAKVRALNRAEGSTMAPFQESFKQQDDDTNTDNFAILPLNSGSGDYSETPPLSPMANMASASSTNNLNSFALTGSSSDCNREGCDGLLSSVPLQYNPDIITKRETPVKFRA